MLEIQLGLDFKYRLYTDGFNLYSLPNSHFKDLSGNPI